MSLAHLLSGSFNICRGLPESVRDSLALCRSFGSGLHKPDRQVVREMSDLNEQPSRMMGWEGTVCRMNMSREADNPASSISQGWQGMGELLRLRYDARRFAAQKSSESDTPLTTWGWLKLFYRNKALWSIAAYRWNRYLQREATAATRLLASVPVKLFTMLAYFVARINIHPGADIGPGLYIGHFGGIWISPKTTMGANCNLAQGVVIGAAGKRRGAKLGDRVWVGPHAVITGPSNLADGVVVGANSTVATDAPENAVMLGVPAKPISYTGSAKLVQAIPIP